MEKNAKPKRMYIGEVISDKMNKTITVKTTRVLKHPEFSKILRKSKKYKVHDEEGKAKLGDTVEFYEGAPISKTKYMYLARIISSQTA